MRNQGIEACLAGKVKEGVDMIKHAYQHAQDGAEPSANL